MKIGIYAPMSVHNIRPAEKPVICQHRVEVNKCPFCKKEKVVPHG